MVRPPKYTLGDAVQLHRQHPDTFALHPKEDRESLRVGDVAQLSFEVPGFKSERMWVLVNGRFRNRYVGTLNNAPMQPSFPLSFGDKVTFFARHIYRLGQLSPLPKDWTDSPFLAKEPEIARQMNEHQPSTDVCAQCGEHCEHGSECIEHSMPVRVVTFRRIAEAVFAVGLKEAWVRHDYHAIAQMGARRGESYMADEVGKVPNEKLGFPPEFCVFDKNGDFRVVICRDINGGGKDDTNRIVSALFANKTPEGTKVFEDIEPEGILVMSSATVSKTFHDKMRSINDPEAQEKEFQAHPPTLYPDKVTVADARVFLAPDHMVANAGILVGTDEELAAAGFEKPPKAA